MQIFVKRNGLYLLESHINVKHIVYGLQICYFQPGTSSCLHSTRCETTKNTLMTMLDTNPLNLD